MNGTIGTHQLEDIILNVCEGQTHTKQLIANYYNSFNINSSHNTTTDYMGLL